MSVCINKLIILNLFQDTWWMILVALACSSSISFLWIILMRFLTGVMVWTSIVLLILGSGGGLGYSVFR